MVTAGQGVVWGAVLLVSVVFAGVGAATYRRESFPGRASFATYCLGLAAMLLATLAFRVVDAVGSGMADAGMALAVVGVLLLVGAFVVGLLAPLAWGRFALAYTGQRVPTTRRTLLLVGLPVAVTVGILVLWAVIPIALVLLQYGPPPQEFGVVADGIRRYAVRMTAFYLGSLLVAGAALVGWTSYTNRHLSTRGGAALAAGCVLPWMAAVVPVVAELFEDVFLEAAHAAAGGVLGAALLVAAVYRHDVFERVPAAGTIGRDVTVEAMNDPVVVVDGAHRVVDLNPAADRLFDASTAAVGEPLAALLGDAAVPEDLLSAAPTEFELAGGGRVIEARGSELRDEYDRLLGHSVVFHDVTDRKRRQQRIQVLNRVLRHNLRNDMVVVNGYAEALSEMPVDLQEYPQRIKQTADGLIAIGEKAREVEMVVAAQQDRTAPLPTVVRDVVADAERDHPDCTFDVAAPVADVHVHETVLTAVLRELLDNGARHNDADDPRVEVATGPAGDDAVELTVTDNGPGIPDHELAPIREGAETDLEHGSGLGVWLVEWGMSVVDGDVAFERGDPRGTTVTLRIPAAN